MKKSNRLLRALSAAGVATGVILGQAALDNAFAARFKGPDDKGRPDIFGEPGVPDIGPPGQYEG